MTKICSRYEDQLKITRRSVCIFILTRYLLQNLISGQTGRKSNSLNDLVLQGPTAKGSGKKNPYANIESKVKNYIASLPAPNTRRKTFKKHTSMPGYIGDCALGHSEASITSCLHLEQEYSQYRRQSEHTISELEKQVQVAVTMIGQANNENHELMDRIDHLEKECKVYSRPTPVPSQVTVAQLALTPRKAMPINRVLADDTTGSFIGQSLTVTTGTTSTTTTECHSGGISPAGTKRNLSFNSSSELTRRSGTDSGINTSDGNEIQVHEVEGTLSGRSGVDEEEEEEAMMPMMEKRRKKKKTKKKRLRKYMARLLCCVTADTAVVAEAGPRIFYKKL